MGRTRDLFKKTRDTNGIFHAKMGTIKDRNGMDACMLSHFSHVQLIVPLWTVACQVPLSMGLSRQEYWSGIPYPPPADLPDPGI